MKRVVVIGIVVVLAAGGVLTAQAPHGAELQMKAAQHKAEAEGDLQGAIEDYKKVIRTAGTDRAIVAAALIHMAECYQKLGDTEAHKIYERVVRDYADQKDAVTTARTHLGGAGQMAGHTAIALRKVWTGDTSGAISPDGRYLTYVGNFNTALFLRDMTTGADRPLTSGIAGTYTSAISRDGTQVAYNWCTRESCEVRVASLQGNGVPTSRRVFANEEVAYVVPMDWSTDGKSLAVSIQRRDRTAQIGLVAVSDGALRVLKSVDWRGPSKMLFSPDSRDIAFDLAVNENSEERDVFVLAADGSREVTAVAQPGNDIVMGWTPDGKQLLFASNRSGAMGLWAQAFAERKPQGAPELVKSDLGNVSPLGIT